MSQRQPTLSELFLDFFWPNRCPFCGEIIAPQQHCCPDCLASFPPPPDVFVPLLDAAFAFTTYTPEAARAIHLLKFYNQPKLGAVLAKLIFRTFEQELADCRIDCICATPMHPKKQRERGYNQAERMATELARLCQLPCLPLLEKTVQTSAQHTLSAEQRKHNLRGSCRVALPDKVKEGAAAAIPMKHMGEPEDIANLAAFLASDQARYITGEVIRVDGGLAM